MPRGVATKKSNICGLCTNTVTNHLCEIHEAEVEGIQELCGGNFRVMMELLAGTSLIEGICGKSDLVYLVKKITQQWQVRTKPSTLYNATQAFKQFCRRHYNKNKYLTKPPKNSASKDEFMLWAVANGVDVELFEKESVYEKNKKRSLAERVTNCSEEGNYMNPPQNMIVHGVPHMPSMVGSAYASIVPTSYSLPHSLMTGYQTASPITFVQAPQYALPTVLSMDSTYSLSRNAPSTVYHSQSVESPKKELDRQLEIQKEKEYERSLLSMLVPQSPQKTEDTDSAQTTDSQKTEGSTMSISRILN